MQIRKVASQGAMGIVVAVAIAMSGPWAAVPARRMHKGRNEMVDLRSRGIAAGAVGSCILVVEHTRRIRVSTSRNFCMSNTISSDSESAY
jgi:hypothetical protein